MKGRVLPATAQIATGTTAPPVLPPTWPHPPPWARCRAAGHPIPFQGIAIAALKPGEDVFRALAHPASRALA